MIEIEIVVGGEAGPQDFLRVKQMADVGPRVPLADGTITVRIERAEILREPRVLDIEDAFGRKQLPGSCIAGGQYAVEHIYAPLHGIQYIYRRSDAHQVAWFFGWQQGGRPFNRFITVLRGFPDGKPANGIARKIEGD